MATKTLRVVLDTNVFLSAMLSKNPSSPTRELVEHWQNGEFVLLICDALADELIGKLTERRIRESTILDFVQLLGYIAEWVDVPEKVIERLIPDDPDDDVVIACALLGQADYLVTYDPHFDVLGEIYRGVKISRALPFLWALRGDQP